MGINAKRKANVDNQGTPLTSNTISMGPQTAAKLAERKVIDEPHPSPATQKKKDHRIDNIISECYEPQSEQGNVTQITTTPLVKSNNELPSHKYAAFGNSGSRGNPSMHETGSFGANSQMMHKPTPIRVKNDNLFSDTSINDS